jgi:flagellar hook-basal body complex protein FliE
MTELGVIGNAILIVLLAIALVSVWRLNRRIGELREGRAAFEKLTADLARQTEAASGSVGALRHAAETLGKQLDTGSDRGRQVIAEMQRASDDLRLLIGRADAASSRLESVISQSRSAELLMGAFDRQPAAALDRRGERADVRPAEPSPAAIAEESSPEAAAFLSSLSGMR